MICISLQFTNRPHALAAPKIMKISTVRLSSRRSRQAHEERKGALKVFLCTLGDLRGGYLHISRHEGGTPITMKTEPLSVSAPKRQPPLTDVRGSIFRTGHMP